MSRSYQRPTLCPCAKDFPDDSARVDDGTFVCFPHKIGSTILLYGKRNTKFPRQAVVRGTIRGLAVWILVFVSWFCDVDAT